MTPTPLETAPESKYDPNGALENCISRIAAGEQEALSLLYESTRAAVYGFALSIVKNSQDAEDVLQDVYVKIWEAAPVYRPMGKPLAWIFTITRNFALMSIRRQSRTVPGDPADFPETFAPDEAVGAENRMLLDSVMGLLSEDEQEIVILHAVAGMKHREIAELLNLGLSTVLSRYNRALKKLRTALKEA